MIDLVKYKHLIENKNNFFYKNFNYFKTRYFLYRKNDYLINKFEFKNFKSFFILKYERDKLDQSFVILDHFGSRKLKSKHMTNLINERKKIIFLSDKKIYKNKFKILNNLNFKIGCIEKYNLKLKNKVFLEKEIFLGDTDIFITIGEN